MRFRDFTEVYVRRESTWRPPEDGNPVHRAACGGIVTPWDRRGPRSLLPDATNPERLRLLLEECSHHDRAAAGSLCSALTDFGPMP